MRTRIDIIASQLACCILAACGGGDSSAPVGAALDPASSSSPLVDGEGIAAISSALSPKAAVTYIKASNTGVTDFFGFKTALSADGMTLAVAAYFERSSATGVNGNQNDDSAINSGAVYVFTRNPKGGWSQQAYIKASNTNAGDLLGSSLALSGDGQTLAIGASHEDSNATGINGNQMNNFAGNSGAVYVFARSGKSWTQQAHLKASNTGLDDQFGRSVALSFDGTTLAVGAINEASSAVGSNGNQADGSMPGAGAVYVFTRTAKATWTQQAYIKASNTAAGDGFGRDVALSSDGNTLAVTAASEDSGATVVDGNQFDNSATDAGAVYVFTRQASVWSQQAYIKAANADAGDNFGSAIALSADGSTLAVGALHEDSASDGKPIDNSAIDAGAVYVFARNQTGTWKQAAMFKAPSTDAGDWFGWSVALSADGLTLAAGAPYEASNASGINGDASNNSLPYAGAVHMFTFTKGAWVPHAYIKASNPDSNDIFGRTIALSAGGETLAVGATSEDSGATGINGAQLDNSVPHSGAVYVYR